MLGVLVPEVEGAVGTRGAEGAVLWVEGDGVYRVDFCYVTRSWVLLAVAFEGEVEAGRCVSLVVFKSIGNRKLPGVFVFDVLNGTSALD